jgi:ABC-type Fe3+-siderophore transport system permease subunit
MEKYWINNYRMGGYLLFACGLINLRYQWGESDIFLRSAMIFVPGAAVIGATFVPALVMVLARREVKVLLAIAGIALIAFAFSN